MRRSRLRRLRTLAANALRSTLDVATKRKNRGEAEPLGEAHITFLSPSSEVAGSGTVPEGVSILKAAKTLDIDIDHFCGGHASCGTCRVTVVDGGRSLSAMRGMEEMTLGASGIAKNQRLACQALVLGAATVRIPRWF